MKVGTFVLVIVLLLVVSLSFAGDKISIEDTYGTWVNADYNEKGKMAKCILYPDDTFEFFNTETDTEPDWTGKCTITDSWNDSKGNLWIKATVIYNEDGSSAYRLSKYSNSGTIWEMVESGSDYPDELSPIAGDHYILYRQ